MVFRGAENKMYLKNSNYPGMGWAGLGWAKLDWHGLGRITRHRVTNSGWLMEWYCSELSGASSSFIRWIGFFCRVEGRSLQLKRLFGVVHDRSSNPKIHLIPAKDQVRRDIRSFNLCFNNKKFYLHKIFLPIWGTFWKKNVSVKRDTNIEF